MYIAVLIYVSFVMGEMELIFICLRVNCVPFSETIVLNYRRFCLQGTFGSI